MFSQGVKSWRELPLRYADFGVLHRNEVRRQQRTDGHLSVGITAMPRSTRVPPICLAVDRNSA